MGYKFSTLDKRNMEWFKKDVEARSLLEIHLDKLWIYFSWKAGYSTTRFTAGVKFYSILQG